MSKTTQTSQTAQDYIASQLRLEAEAREALPYQFDTCTKPFGPLRQFVFACLTCSPPPASPHQQHTPAGVCYSCSISCHGEHNLVELFTKRDFVCDCGTTRLSNSGTTCSLRPHPVTGTKGGVRDEEARQGNKYNQNYEGKFCGCGEEYDPEMEKGTMFQCLGLGTVEDGGCGEDWWHPECLMGLPRIKHEEKVKVPVSNGALETVKEEAGNGGEQPVENGTAAHEDKEWDDPPLPEGFPNEDDFDHLLCYKCTSAFPWIKQYAGTPGFLPAVSATGGVVPGEAVNLTASTASNPSTNAETQVTNKRKAEDDAVEDDSQDSKRVKADTSPPPPPPPTTNGSATNHADRAPQDPPPPPKHTRLPPNPPTGSHSLFLTTSFHQHLCRCPTCFPLLSRHPQLLEPESSYSPPISATSSEDDGRQSSLLSRGEAALSSIDRVRAIEGVMAYNHVKEKVKSFLAPFAESGEVVSAEDIKGYFAKLRGDEEGARATAGVGGGRGVEGDGRREQGGY